MKLASLFLRIGLAFVFLYAAIESLLNPGVWAGFLPVFLTSMIPAGPLLTGFSVYEILLAGWLLWGARVRYAAILAAITLAGITFVNLAAIDTVFRDVGLIFAALALAALG